MPFWMLILDMMLPVVGYNGENFLHDYMNRLSCSCRYSNHALQRVLLDRDYFCWQLLNETTVTFGIVWSGRYEIWIDRIKIHAPTTLFVFLRNKGNTFTTQSLSYFTLSSPVLSIADFIEFFELFKSGGIHMLFPQKIGIKTKYLLFQWTPNL